MRTIRLTADLVKPDPITCKFCGIEIQEHMPQLRTGRWGRDGDTYDQECLLRKPGADGDHDHEPADSTNTYGEYTELGHGATEHSGWYNPTWDRTEVYEDESEALTETLDDTKHVRRVESRRMWLSGDGYQVLICSCGEESGMLIAYEDADEILADANLIKMDCNPAHWLAALVGEHVGYLDNRSGETFYGTGSEDFSSGISIKVALHADGFSEEELEQAEQIIRKA